MNKYSVMVVSTIMILLGAVALHADYTTGNNYQHGAEPPTAGIALPNDMNQLPSPTPDVNRSPAAPDKKTLYQPKCGVDSSLMEKYREQNPGSTDNQPKDVQIGSFSCRA